MDAYHQSKGVGLAYSSRKQFLESCGEFIPEVNF